MQMDSNPNHAEQTQQAREVEIRRVSLADISGVHNAILELEHELSLPPLSLPSREALSAGILRVTLKAYPVWVVKAKEKFICVGNVQMYRLAASCMAPRDEIPVLVFHTRSTRDAIKTNYLVERYVLPAVFALEMDDVRRLHEVWQNNLDNSHFKTAFPVTTTTAFADVFRVSPRSLRNHETQKPE